MGRSKHYIILLIICSGLLFSCVKTNVFEKSTTIPGYNWNEHFAVKGSFEIKDTTSAYNSYIVLRHTDAYRYSNIWLNFGLQAPGDSMHYSKINMELGTDAGGWMGNGMDDIWELRQLIVLPFKKPGIYNYSISQIMRDNPLTGVISAGLRVEKQQQ